jgi:hypothetical protein
LGRRSAAARTRDVAAAGLGRFNVDAMPLDDLRVARLIAAGSSLAKLVVA